MPAGSSTSRTVLKYALVQIPSAALVLVGLLLLRFWMDIPGWGVVAGLAVWVIKDILLFPLVRRAYEPHEVEPGASLIGVRGLARQRLSPAGYIQIRGELWRAELEAGRGPVEEGEEVTVLAVRGLTLLVEPAGRGQNALATNKHE